MIEIENMQSTVTDHTLRMVLLFCDIETKDKLLYEGDEYYKVMPNDGLSRGIASHLEGEKWYNREGLG